MLYDDDDSGHHLIIMMMMMMIKMKLEFIHSIQSMMVVVVYVGDDFGHLTMVIVLAFHTPTNQPTKQTAFSKKAKNNYANLQYLSLFLAVVFTFFSR